MIILLKKCRKLLFFFVTLLFTPFIFAEAFDEPVVLMWQVPPHTSEQELLSLANLGVTHTQSFAASKITEIEILKHLKALERAGLKTILHLGKHVITERGCSFSENVVERVKLVKGNAVIAAWHTLDEPAIHGISKKCQTELYNFIKNIDPDTPIMVSTNNNRRNKYKDFFAERAFDILEMHYYVNPKIDRGQRSLIEFFKEFSLEEYPVIITFRGFESPHKKNRKKMTQNSLREQYKFFIVESDVTKSFGFYGWKLEPNRGISQLPQLRREFEQFMEWWKQGKNE